MKKEYELRGIDCGNCAAKIERAVNQLEQVESATVNLISSKADFGNKKRRWDR